LPEYRFNIIQGKDHLTALAEQLAIYANFLWENMEISALIGDSPLNVNNRPVVSAESLLDTQLDKVDW
jgi:hypothetical protein